MGAEMGIVPSDPDRPPSPPDRILGRNGEETAKTQRTQTALETPIPKQVALLTDPKPTLGPGRIGIPPRHLRSLGMFFQLIRRPFRSRWRKTGCSRIKPRWSEAPMR